MSAKYLVLIEKAENNFSAYPPDLPGCGVVGDTRQEVIELIRQGIEMHLAGMREDGDPIPEPSTTAEMVEVD